MSSSVPIKIDLTAPTGTASRTPLANANGWTSTDVTATFTCADALSGAVAAGSSQTITTEGAGQSRDFLCVDQAGNSRALSVAVTANFTRMDAISGAVSPGSSQMITTEGAGQSRDF